MSELDSCAEGMGLINRSSCDIAVVIPFFKLRYFEETLKSLTKQTDKHFTVYIGDDGSPECPAEMISRYEGQLHISYKRFDENLGGTSLVSHWHRCLDMMADEKWVMILGDDDFLNPNCVEELLKAIGISDGTTSVYRFATEVIDERSGVTRGPFKGPDKESCFEFIERKFLQGSRSSLSEYVFRADILKEKRFRDYPLAWFADVMAVIEVSEGLSIKGINTASVGVRVSPQSISGSVNHHFAKRIAEIEFRKDVLSLFHAKVPIRVSKEIARDLGGLFASGEMRSFVEACHVAITLSRTGLVPEALSLTWRLATRSFRKIKWKLLGS